MRTLISLTRLALLTVVAGWSVAGGSPLTQASEPLAFDIRPLALDANEGMAAGDVDGDSRTDLVAGRFWFSGDDWIPRPLRLIDDWNGYVQSNGDYLFDVNRDGRLDVIAQSFLPTTIHWYENPGEESLRLGKLWPAHLLVDTGNSANEGQLFQDLDGDGRPEWIVNSWKKDVPMVVWRLVPTDKPDAAGAHYRMLPAELGPTGNGHGIGVGDLSGDGRLDVLVGQGWYEQPAESPWDQPWRFHSAWDMHASLPILVVDLNQDGRQDLIFGKGHDYGLYWWENRGADEAGKIAWEEHLIDRGFSQPHSMAWVDLTGDGQPELVTGKRYYAHNGNDPGGQEPPCLFYYTWDGDEAAFTRHVVDQGRVGTGLQIVAQDLNGDGRVDLAVAGKSGTYLLTAKAPAAADATGDRSASAAARDLSKADRRRDLGNAESAEVPNDSR